MNIKIVNASKKYYEKEVLYVDELNFQKGKVYALMGLNGSGKSTLLQCSSGLDSLTSGEIIYNNCKDINSFRKNISVMVQKPYLFNSTVKENIIIGLKFRKLSEGSIENKLEQYLSYFQINNLLNKNARELSGGEQARVALLRTAILETEVTFLDEPTASMDIESTFQAEKLIINMATKERSVIFVTHDFFQAERVADYVIFLDKGKIIEKGETSEVINYPKHNLLKQILQRGEQYDSDRNIDNK